MTVTVYVPAASAEISSVVAPLLHAKLYGETPPITVKSIAPLSVPVQVTSLDVRARLRDATVSTKKNAEAEQPVESVTVMV